MNKKLKSVLVTIIILFLSSCNQKNCNQISTKFSSYESALKIIKNSKFSISEKCYTSKSSWINNIEYFSCDGHTGFLLLKTKSRTYIYSNVPISIWNSFKKAKSFGKYYNQNIKEKYSLILNNDKYRIKENWKLELP